MAMDPETRRITMQDREFAEGDFPLGLRGLDWPIRMGEISDEDWAKMLAGTLSNDEVNVLHRATWTKNGATPWPSL